MKSDGNQMRAKKLIANAGSSSAVVIPQAYIRLTGDMNSAAVLNQILYWSDRAGNANGWFAKSYIQWTKETGLSEYQIRRIVKRLKSFGIETCLKRADGSPTVHYRIDYEVFEQILSEFLGVETTESNPKKLQNPNAESEGNDLQTIDSETKEQESMIEEKAISFASEEREPLQVAADDWRWDYVREACKLPKEIKLRGIEGDVWRVEGAHEAFAGLRTLRATIAKTFGARIEYQVRGVGVPAWAST